jgi:hypothetical protein
MEGGALYCASAGPGSLSGRIGLLPLRSCPGGYYCTLGLVGLSVRGDSPSVVLPRPPRRRLLISVAIPRAHTQRKTAVANHCSSARGGVICPPPTTARDASMRRPEASNNNNNPAESTAWFCVRFENLLQRSCTRVSCLVWPGPGCTFWTPCPALPCSHTCPRVGSLAGTCAEGSVVHRATPPSPETGHWLLGYRPP